MSLIVFAVVLLASSSTLVSSQGLVQPPLIMEFTNVNGAGSNFHEIDPDQSFELECVAKGEPAPEIAWFKDDAKVEGLSGVSVSGNKIVFSEPDVEQHVGHYHCEATNKWGKAKSQVVLVARTTNRHPEWATMPKFEETPEVEINELGTTAEFRCKASGSPEPEIIWTKNGVELVESRGKPSVLIDGVTEKDIGTYACNASNLVGYVYKMVYLNILTQPPYFLEGPRSRKVSIGQEVILRCSVKAYPLPSVHWTVNGVDLATKADPNLEVSERNDLTIKRVRNDSAASYECHAKNALGNVTSAARLTVVSTTTIEEGPNDMRAQIQSTVRMNCSVLWDPSLQLNIIWKKDNVDIDPDADPRIVVDHTHALTIKDVRFGDAGTYTCVASTSQGSSTDSGMLTVTGIPPQLEYGPSAQTVVEGTTIVILCKVTGTPKPVHTWFNDTNRINFARNPRVRMDEDGSLIIKNANLNDSNKYVCRADNGHGEAIVESAFIDIRTATKLVKGPEHQQYVSGENYTLDCLVEVDPRLEETLNVTWMKDDEPINPAESERHEVFSNWTLSVIDVTEDDIGSYKCVARTPVDEIIIEASIYGDKTSWWWLIVLLALILLLLVILLICFVCFVRRKMKKQGRYGVKDVEDGKNGKRHNKSDIMYSIDGVSDSVNDDLLDDGDTKKPIFSPKKDKQLLGGGGDVKGSENSLLNLTDEEIWLRKGMNEDGSFRDGYYGE